MRLMMTAALAGLYLFAAPVLATVGTQQLTKLNETIVYKTTAEGTWPFKVSAAADAYLDIQCVASKAY